MAGAQPEGRLETNRVVGIAVGKPTTRVHLIFAYTQFFVFFLSIESKFCN